MGAGRAPSNPAVEHEECRHQNRGGRQQECEGAHAPETDVGPADSGSGRQRKDRGNGRGQTADRLQRDHRGEQAGGRRDRRSHPGWAEEPKSCGRRGERQRRNHREHHNKGEKIAHVEVADGEELGCPPQQVVDRLCEGEVAQTGNRQYAGAKAPVQFTSVGVERGSHVF